MYYDKRYVAISYHTSLKLLGITANKNYTKLELLKDITFIYLLRLPHWKDIGE